MRERRDSAGARDGSGRAKFDRYMDRATRLAFLEVVRRRVLPIAVSREAEESLDLPCRDPKDNKFLALAFAAEADAVVSGDDGLLVLHPWHGIAIVSPREFIG